MSEKCFSDAKLEGALPTAMWDSDKSTLSGPFQLKLNRQKIVGISLALAACSVVAGLIYGVTHQQKTDPNDLGTCHDHFGPR